MVYTCFPIQFQNHYEVFQTEYKLYTFMPIYFADTDCQICCFIDGNMMKYTNETKILIIWYSVSYYNCLSPAIKMKLTAEFT